MIELNNGNFEELVLKADKPVVVDFWAEWCGPCKFVGPIMDQLAEEFKDTIVVAKLNIDDNHEISSRYGIRAIPTVLFFKNGNVADKQVGATQKALYTRKIEDLI